MHRWRDTILGTCKLKVQVGGEWERKKAEQWPPVCVYQTSAPVSLVSKEKTNVCLWATSTPSAHTASQAMSDGIMSGTTAIPRPKHCRHKRSKGCLTTHNVLTSTSSEIVVVHGPQYEYLLGCVASLVVILFLVLHITQRTAQSAVLNLRLTQLDLVWVCKVPFRMWLQLKGSCWASCLGGLVE